MGEEPTDQAMAEPNAVVAMEVDGGEKSLKIIDVKEAPILPVKPSDPSKPAKRRITPMAIV